LVGSAYFFLARLTDCSKYLPALKYLRKKKRRKKREKKKLEEKKNKTQKTLTPF
tara:strand:- start:238 stop:399 length:162 start_codon:yes stop_codon:yes gene_type:complete